MPKSSRPRLPRDPLTAEQIQAKVKEAAKRSGKPLEVTCARSFFTWGHRDPEPRSIASEWKIHLNSHYDDGKGTIRELDVLARKGQYLETIGASAALQVLMSCKGFPDDEWPVSFSVTEGAVPTTKPLAMLSHVDAPGRNSSLGNEAPNALMSFLYKRGEIPDLLNRRVRRIVGLGIVKDSADSKQVWQNKGDKTLFEGYESARAAAVFWHGQKLPVYNHLNEPMVRFELPVLVSLRPWHDIPIEDGKIGNPSVTHWGVISNLYPIDGELHPFFCLMVSQDKLQVLQGVLLELFDWLRREADTAFRRPK